jgi:DNA-binding CsgD family transcriptional regulator
MTHPDMPTKKRLRKLPVTQEEINEACRLKLIGMSSSEISKQMGIAARRVWYLHSISPVIIPLREKRNTRIPQEIFEEAFRLHRDELLSWPAIGKMLGLCPKRFARAFKERYSRWEVGRVHHEIKCNRLRRNHERNSVILDLRGKGYTYKAICSELGLTVHQVHGVLRRYADPVEYVPDLHY